MSIGPGPTLAGGLAPPFIGDCRGHCGGCDGCGILCCDCNDPESVSLCCAKGMGWFCGPDACQACNTQQFWWFLPARPTSQSFASLQDAWLQGPAMIAGQPVQAPYNNQCINVGFLTRQAPPTAGRSVPTPRPACVPNGTGNTIRVQFHDANDPTTADVSGLWVNAPETGVTLSSACSYITFYFNSGGTKTVSTAGGPGQNCRDHNTYTYSSASGSGMTGSSLDLSVSR